MPDQGLENVHVFEVDPQVPNSGSPSIHQGIRQSHGAELNIIVSDPSQMAAQQASQSRQKQSPTNGNPPPLLPPMRLHEHHSPPQRPIPTVSFL